ncbi:MerR family transcriptional regulator [Paenibacillus humicola]|uniref:MerR family transcriptional regulator n=1 Tax=Paenibacillus humicola TaxID=3110540 RepID=UPI00237C4500|nr:MerR family transcriptional regulator [Paenibacillus humicola]
MEAKKTKEAALMLGVSQTTIKRWVAFFHMSFRKDRFGHYIFDEADIDKLAFIKEQIEQGLILSQIELPGHEDVREEQTNGAADGLNAGEVLSRIKQLEFRLAQKADDVVSIQVLQHRKELEEIRKTVEQLAASVESMRQSERKAAVQQIAVPVPAAEPSSPKPARKRGLLGSLFHLF